MKIVFITLIVLVCLFAAGLAFETYSRAQDDRAYPPPGNFLAVGDRSLHYQCDGSSDQPLVLLEAGAGGSMLDWSGVIPLLSNKVRLCAYDRAGLGWSERGPAPRDLNALLNDTAQVLEAVGDEEPIIIVGHSFGGLIAQALARQEPDRFAGLVLIDALEIEYLKGQRDQIGSQATIMGVGAALSVVGIPRLLGLAAAPPDADEKVREAMVARSLRTETLKTIAEEASAAAGHIETFEALPPIRDDLPVLVVSRTQVPEGDDAAWFEAQRRLGELTTETTSSVAPTTNHYVQLASPELVSRAILDVVERTGSISRADPENVTSN